MTRARTRTDTDGVRRAIRAEALKQLGKPYRYGASWQEAPKVFDCSSFVQYVYKRAGIEIPRVSIEQARRGRRVPSGAQLKVGDLIFTRSVQGRYDRQFPEGIGHVYLVTGPDEVVHARSRRPSGVVRQRLATVLKRKDVTVIKRIL